MCKLNRTWLCSKEKARHPQYLRPTSSRSCEINSLYFFCSIKNLFYIENSKFKNKFSIKWEFQYLLRNNNAESYLKNMEKKLLEEKFWKENWRKMLERKLRRKNLVKKILEAKLKKKCWKNFFKKKPPKGKLWNKNFRTTIKKKKLEKILQKNFKNRWRKNLKKNLENKSWKKKFWEKNFIKKKFWKENFYKKKFWKENFYKKKFWKKNL